MLCVWNLRLHDLLETDEIAIKKVKVCFITMDLLNSLRLNKALDVQK